MEATAALVSARQRPVRMEVMAAPEAAADLLAAAASEEPAATARLETTDWRELILVIQASMLRPEELAAMEELAVQADRFQAMVETEAWRA